MNPVFSSRSLLMSVVLLCADSAALAAEPALPLPPRYETRESWRQPVPPVRIAEHTWHIGTASITTLLLKTDDGAILIDGGVPQAADMLLSHMKMLGVEPHDLKLILHSHAHADHTGPFAAIKRATGATLVSNAESAAMLARGGSDDIHFGDGITFPPVQVDRLLHDGEIVELGSLRLTVHFTPGHTPGSMSWTWDDVRDGNALHIAYVDSISAPGYRLIDNPRYPRIVGDYRASFATIRALPCDVLLSPHPDFSGWNYADTLNPRPTPMTCRAYADTAETALDATLEEQRATPRKTAR